MGEALLIVDTDAPVPALAGRLRIDFYTEQGTWFESRDVAAPDPSAWPVSFSAFNPDETRTRVVLVRLRAYPEGKTRDYRGERFTPRGEEEPSPRDLRLVISGTDVTPRTEPLPGLTIDRLVRVALEPGRVGSVRIVLRGECFGTMADLATGSTCVDTENVRVRSELVISDADMRIPRQSVQGAFGKSEPCEGSPTENEVCIPGGAFIFGNASEYGKAESSGVPERVARMSPFYMDRYEYTVARWRAIYTSDGEQGTSASLAMNDGPLANGSKSGRDDALCSPSRAPLGRETFALTCVPWQTAQFLCRRDGSDLPTEAQWEYAAMAAGRAAKTAYPWGSEPITCDRTVYGRFAGSGFERNVCAIGGTGPLPVDASHHEAGDVSPLGIVGLGGGVSEWLGDAFSGYDQGCWRGVGIGDPSCPPASNSLLSVRGGNWASNALAVSPQARRGVDPIAFGEVVGFRCTRVATKSQRSNQKGAD